MKKKWDKPTIAKVDTCNYCDSCASANFCDADNNKEYQKKKKKWDKPKIEVLKDSDTNFTTKECTCEGCKTNGGNNNNLGS